ncbi:hypothetical protein CDD81_2000 [Ophiocordyceps australis]|uniref:Plus3 domain-containing protein n=1 Tax=Ophiocordyceps australis TaxID=1399860 RepID=A0A2C5Y7V1_9HYPO|nr:hypothetical protein CDD81_2000 [Ophiocordyceps australis]
MADIDISDDLLDLAGGGGSDDEGSITSRRDVSSSRSPPRERKEVDSMSPARQKRQPRDDESEEEGEAQSAPASPNSLDSAPMDESDSEDEQPMLERPAFDGAADSNEKYPVDGMFVSKVEKEEIMALREVEREQILAERVSEIERQRQNLLLRQMVTTVENEERKHVKKKRSADSADLEQDERKTVRPRTTKASETAMDSLRRARAEKQRRKEDQERRKDDASPRRGLRETRSDDGDDFARPRSRSDDKEADKQVPPAELVDFERVRLGRSEFAQVCSTPGFDAAITGCFIRIAVGAHPETGIEQYRMAVIKGFVTGRPYALTSSNGVFVTDQYMRAAHGKAVREFPFISASNSKFTESELNRYRITCQNENVSLPTKQALIDKIDVINGLIHHKWTGEEIKARLAKRNELKKRFDPAERERIACMRDEAAARGDDERAEELQEQLDKLSNQRLAFRTSLGPPKGLEAPKSSEQDRLAERNRENRRMNVELVRKAQLREKAKVREIEKAIQRGEQVPDDLSRRLRTRAKFVYDVNEMAQHVKGGKGGPTPETSTAPSTPAKESTPKPGSGAKPQMAAHMARLQEKQYEENKGLPRIHKPLMDDDIIGSLDLDIDVEI